MDLESFQKQYEKVKVEENHNNVPSKPMLSVCVQTYQHVNYIKECLDSILEQKTDFEFEILLGEDNSLDGTREICIEYANEYPDKIRLFKHHRDNNIAIDGSPTGRFNFMYNIYSAKGKYIAFCEGDDFWNDPVKLQTQVDFLEHHDDYVLTYHDAKVIDVNNIVTKESKLKPKNKRDYFANELQKGAHAQTLTMCFRKVVNEFPLEIFKVLNGDTFLISMLGHYGKGKYLESIKPASYRIHSGGIWSIKTRQKFFESRIRLYSGLMNYYKRLDNLELEKYFRLKLRNTYFGLLEYSIENKKRYKVEDLQLILQYSGENKITTFFKFVKSVFKGSLKLLKSYFKNE